jgi:serine palmitoyltransferase
MGEDGTDIGRNKLHALRDNSNYFRMRLRDMGLLVLGQYDSPVMPIMVYHPSKLAFFSRELFKRGVAVVVVGFPAVPLLTARARICMSASHTRADLDYALEQINEVGHLLELKYAKSRR